MHLAQGNESKLQVYNLASKTGFKSYVKDWVSKIFLPKGTCTSISVAETFFPKSFKDILASLYLCFKPRKGRKYANINTDINIFPFQHVVH